MRGLTWRPLDLLTRKFWRLAGRPVETGGAEAWLLAPMSRGSLVAADWVEAEAARTGGTVLPGEPDAGLLPTMDLLNGPGFDAATLHPLVRDFYEHTSLWRMQAHADWAPVFWPAGAFISRFFGRRVQQLALPTRRSDVAAGIDSAVTVILDADGRQRAAAWLRTLRSTGDFLFSGCYSTRSLPGQARPSIHVAFPLESGNVQVFLTPRVLDGALVLESLPGPWGSPGAYVAVSDGDGVHAARVPLHETFHVHVDAAGTLRTEHVLRLGRVRVVRLQYVMERVR